MSTKSSKPKYVSAISQPSNLSTFLNALHDGKLGYKFGEPQRIDPNSLAAVLPILRETSEKRQYVTYPETDKVSVTDSGSIQQMKASSVSTENVFMRSGTIFKGGTQERALVRSVIIFPGKTMDLEVRCVHASRGIQPGSKVGYGGITPSAFDSCNYDAGFRPKDQGETWANVSAYTRSLHKSVEPSCPPLRPGARRSIHPTRSLRAQASGSSMRSDDRIRMGLSSLDSRAGNYACSDFAGTLDFSNTVGLDDLHSAQADFAKNFDSILSKIKVVEHQSGIALINEKGCQTIETFDVPLSWAALHKDAVGRVGSHVVNLDDSSVFAYKPEAAVKAVQGVLAQDFETNLIYEHKPANGEPYVAIQGLTSKEFVGEVVEIDQRVMHLLLVRRAA